jgi:hypothetical protein
LKKLALPTFEKNMNKIQVWLNTLEKAFGCSLSYECDFIENEISREANVSKADFLPAMVMLRSLNNLCGLMQKSVSESLKKQIVLINGKRMLQESIEQATKPVNGILKSRSDVEIKKSFLEGVILGSESAVVDSVTETAIEHLSKYVDSLNEMVDKKIKAAF